MLSSVKYKMFWSLLYSAIFRSWADSLRSRVILHEWIAFYSAFFDYPPKWCTYSAGMVGATWNCCCLSAFCVHHTTMHHVTSCKATYVRCMLGKVADEPHPAHKHTHKHTHTYTHTRTHTHTHNLMAMGLKTSFFEEEGFQERFERTDITGTPRLLQIFTESSRQP